MSVESPVEQLMLAFAADDIAAAAEVLRHHPRALAPGRQEGCESPLRHLAKVRSAAMADVLIEHGLDLHAVSQEWAPGFWLSEIRTEAAERIVERGATLTPHAGAALGLVSRLRTMLDGDPELVHAKGGDGCRPLHFARNVEVADLLLERGASIDARDEDHNSTPAQWRIGDTPEVTRFLLKRGASLDIFMATGLNDLELVCRLATADPVCTTYRIGNNSGPFPGAGFQKRGGTIYQWTLGFNQSPQEIARARGFVEIFDFLMERTPPRAKLLIACMLADRSLAEEVTKQNPTLVAGLGPEDYALLAKSCWETNLNLEAVRLMLDLGFPVNAPEFNHGYTPLHNAAWAGDPELVELLLSRGHPVEERDPSYQATPLGWAIYSCIEARRHPEGNFPEVVRLLLEAGAPVDENMYPTGHAGIDAVLQAPLPGGQL
ncbi:MAG TPA: ankyrin repeat domain-containing protein [Verrucomicrobiales bacterium]|nr:ankyrin repeat domain-containing protein [Verrucomicrobiales bacterium]